ncbi:MAG: hypothetical protein C0490_01730 [Marivirga sp.]|nr:hypothetical protein [Marivirga sp.]
MNMQSLRYACLFLLIIVAPVVAHAAPGAGNIGAGRLLPTVAAVVGLIGVVIGRRALVHSRTGNGLAEAIVATVLGMITVVAGGLHVANSAGGFGTGNGLAGAVVAISLGLAAMVLAGLALARSRKTATGKH